MNKVDLQVHTTISDGTCTPEEVVDLAIRNGISVIAITDHDTIGGIQRALNHAQGKDITIVPGIEISCEEPEHGFRNVHMLGLFIDITNLNLLKFLKNAQSARKNQKIQTIRKLNNLGFDITLSEVKQYAQSSIGRPHIAKALLVKYPDEFTSVSDVFKKYLGSSKPAYVSRENPITLKDAINIVRSASGLSILAHPGVYSKSDSIKLIEIFLHSGGDGIETYYPYHYVCPELRYTSFENQKLIDFYRSIVTEKRILESGGSDFHGEIRNSLNEISIPYEVYSRLKSKIAKTKPV